MSQLLLSLRLALRRLRRAPAVTAAIVLTVALCLGANLAMFAVLDAILLRPLPFPEPERLVAIQDLDPLTGVGMDEVPLARYYAARGQLPALAGLALYRETREVVGAAGTASQEAALRVSPDFLATLGVELARGRSFLEIETVQPLAQHAVILSHDYWRTEGQADPALLGRELIVNGTPRTIVGILPPGFRFLSSEPRLLLPLTSTPAQRSATNLRPAAAMIGRLAAGATLPAAAAQLCALDVATGSKSHSRISLLHAEHVRAIGPTLWLMQGGALLLLLAGLVNVLSLLWLRASAQQQEAALRRTLGAERGHVLQQILIDTLLPVAIGGLLGLGVGALGIQVLSALGTGRLPLGGTVVYDLRTALVGLAGTGLVGLLLALPLAWRQLGEPPGKTLRAGSRGSTDGRTTARLRRALVVVQLALAFVLLTSAIWLGLSLERIRSLSPGFAAPEQVLAGRFTLPYATFPIETGQRLAVLERIAAELAQQPGIIAVGTSTSLPLDAAETAGVSATAETAPAAGASPPLPVAVGVSGDYFTALGIPLKEGRLLTAADARRLDPVCLIDADALRHAGANGPPLGRTQDYRDTSGTARRCTVVGVVGAVRERALTEAPGRGKVYLSYPLHNGGAIYVVVRAQQAPATWIPALRAAVRAAAPELAVSDVRTMAARVSDSQAGRRAPALLAGLVAAIAVLLAALGTYGVLAHALALRRRELAIRQALGAHPARIRAHFVSMGCKLLGAGLLFGLPGAWLAGLALETLLYGVSTADPWPLGWAAGALAAATVAAIGPPAQRAARVAPAQALGAD